MNLTPEEFLNFIKKGKTEKEANSIEGFEESTSIDYSDGFRYGQNSNL